MVGSKLKSVASDLTTFESTLVADFNTLTADAKANLTQALADAKAQGGGVWAAILAALGTPVPAPTPVAGKK